jgi:hypothetical protein
MSRESAVPRHRGKIPLCYSIADSFEPSRQSQNRATKLSSVLDVSWLRGGFFLGF